MKTIKQQQQQQQQQQQYENMEQVKEFHKLIRRWGDSKLYKKVKDYYNEMQEDGEELEESITIETAEEFKKLSENDRLEYIFNDLSFFDRYFKKFDYFIDYEIMSLGHICDYEDNEEHKYVVLNKKITTYLRDNKTRIYKKQAIKIKDFINKSFDCDINSKYDIDYLYNSIVNIIKQ